MGKLQAKETHDMHEGKKDFLALYGILYCSLRYKRTKESLSLAQMSLEETACSVQSKNLQKPSCWAAILMMVLCGWVEMMADSSASQMYGQLAKGTQWWMAKPQCLHYRAAASLLGEIRGTAPLLLVPHSHSDVLGTLDQGSRDNSVHVETLFSLCDTRTEGRGGCLTHLQWAVFWGNAKL